ncbi:MAG: hemolysin family protein [Gemmatimonadales bacterium]
MAWVIIAVLIGINALYVAAEFSAVAVRRTQIQQLAEKGHWLARQLLPLLNNPHALDRYIAACQIGITFSSLVLGAYGQVALTPPLAETLGRLAALEPMTAFGWAAAAVLIGLTIGQMILGELVPKSLALQFPTRIALWTVLPMRWSLRLLSWFIAVLNGSGTAILRLIGMRPGGHHHLHSPEELELLLAESRAGGVLKPAEHRRLTRALQLERRSTREIMVPRTRMQVLDADTSPEELRTLIAASRYTRIPVVAGSIDEVIGLLHTRDLAVAAARGQTELRVRDHLRPILLVPETLPVDGLLSRFREQGQQAAVVLDEYGGTAGLATIYDVLSELVGKALVDGLPRPERLPDGRLRLPGELRADEVTEWLGEDARAFGDGGATSDSITVGGRVLEAIGHVPQPGERVVLDDLEVEVERVAHRAIISVLVTRRPRRETPS